MRVNEVLARVDEECPVAIFAPDFFVQGMKKNVITTEDFTKRKLGDFIVFHLDGVVSSNGVGIAIECARV